MTRVYLAALLAAATVFLAGCWDKVELENRGFVISIGIDKYNAGGEDAAEFDNGEETSRYLVAMALPNMGAMLEHSDDEKSKTVKVAANETVSAAMRLIDSYSSQRLYFGQTKVVVLGEELLNNPELLREAVDALERNREISRKAVILSAKDDVAELMGANIAGEPLMGMFVSDFYRNNSNAVAVAFKQDLQSMIQRLSFSGDALIPQISLEGDDSELKLGGAAVIKNFKLAGWLNDEQMRGYLWCAGGAKGAQVVAAFGNTYVPLRVNKAESNISFSAEGNRILCRITPKVHGTIEEFVFADTAISETETLELLAAEFEKIITEEIEAVSALLQKEYRVDAMGLEERLRKENYKLYLEHEKDFDRAFEEMEIIAEVDVKITSTGVIK